MMKEIEIKTAAFGFHVAKIVEGDKVIAQVPGAYSGRDEAIAAARRYWHLRQLPTRVPLDPGDANAVVEHDTASDPPEMPKHEMRTLTQLAEFLDMLMTRAAIALNGAEGKWSVIMLNGVEVRLTWVPTAGVSRKYSWSVTLVMNMDSLEVMEREVDQGISRVVAGDG